MNPLYQLKISKSLDGRGAAKIWSNTYNFETAFPIEAPDMRSYVNHLVDAEKVGHYNSVHFLNAYVRRLPHTPTEKTGSDFLSFSLAGVGARESTSMLMPLSMVLVLKRRAIKNRSGSVSYRGALTFNDIDLAPNGTFVLKAAAGLTGGVYGHQPMTNALNQAVAGFIPVMNDDPLNFFDYSRQIVGYGSSEVSKRQEKTNRNTAEYNLYNGGRQEINAIKRETKAILRGGPLAAVDPDFLPRLASMGKRVTEILDAMEPRFALKIIKDETLRALPGGPAL